MNLLELNALMNVFLPKLKTSMSQKEILSLMLKFGDYRQYNLESMRIPVDGSYQNMRVNGMAVLGIDLEEKQEALRELVGKEDNDIKITTISAKNIIKGI